MREEIENLFKKHLPSLSEEGIKLWGADFQKAIKDKILAIIQEAQSLPTQSPSFPTDDDITREALNFILGKDWPDGTTLSLDETRQKHSYSEGAKWMRDKLSSAPSLVSEDEINTMGEQEVDKVFGIGNRGDFMDCTDFFVRGFKKCQELSTLLVKEGEKDSEDLALKFAEWISRDYELIWSLSLKKSAWVNKNKHDIYVNGSELHYTGLIEKYGKTTSELLQIFKQEQQKTGNNEK